MKYIFNNVKFPLEEGCCEWNRSSVFLRSLGFNPDRS
jgi:hypothetical protein